MKIAVVSYNKFPEGDAGSVREYMFGKLFKLIGHDVFFIGMGHVPYRTEKEHKGFKYFSLRLANQRIIGKLRNYFGYSSRLKHLLNKYQEKSPVNVILVVDIPINALFMLKRYAKKNGITLIHDSVEWYSPEQFSLGVFSPSYILKDMYNRFLINKQFKVIAISIFLEQHFKYRGLQTVRIPIIFDMQELKTNENKEFSKITLLYAGSPGKKDYLKEMLEGLSFLSEKELAKIEFKILGVTLEQIKKLLHNNEEGFLEKVQSCLKVMGYVPREVVLENLKKADFTVMLRSSDQRYAKAGFPTKVVESLATGTPVILNITSDLGIYIKDMKNGLVVSECSSQAFSHTLKKAINLPNEHLQYMKQKARESAEENFDFRKYKNVLEKLFEIE
jgi:glycosyltransferase involved in cell wall biosynthesis